MEQTIDSAEKCFLEGKLIDSMANGMGRGDGWDAELARLTEDGIRYAGGAKYIVRFTAVASEYDDAPMYAWAETEQEGRELLSAPPGVGWEDENEE